MNIKKILEERNIDTHQLARDIEISYTYANLLVNAKNSKCSKSVMKKIREVYKLSLGDY
jgi:DNA-binding Xre family transcriptional regulator